MKKVGSTIIGLLLCLVCLAQYKFTAVVKDRATNETLPGVTVMVSGSSIIHTTNARGIVLFSGLPDSIAVFQFSHVNYQPYQVSIRLSDTLVHEIMMDRTTHALEEVTVISTTRTDSRIENSPLKVEVLGKEEMDEENTIKPANIASLISDVSGIQIQQSSAVSGNANVRIQGLDGRYTQILRDGMPLFDGFSGGFGILTIPPLDLQQIELVKGSASTLYGGGAIGGLINLISRRPKQQQEVIATLNQSTLKESNANVFAAKRYHHFGYTLFSGYTHQGASDVDHDGFSDVPQLQATIVHPRLFFYPGVNTTIIAGYTGTFEKRIGGDMQVIDGRKNNIHRFFEKNKTVRHTAEFIAEQSFSHHIRGTLKASTSSFDRIIETDQHFFNGEQLNYFTEASLYIPYQKSNWVAGINMIGDRFKKKPSDSILLNNFSNNTIGAFAQYTLHLPENTTWETGLRVDHHNDYGTFVLPRIAVFHRFNDVWASRFGLGMGYKTPNALAPQNVEYDIEKIHPLSASVGAEKSYGFNAEVNFKKSFGEDNTIFINQAFFLTNLTHPIIANLPSADEVYFSNADQPILTRGSDTYMQLRLNEWEIYAGYTFTIAERKYLQQHQFMPLTPKNRFAFTLVKEIEESWRFGLEGSYTGPQFRDQDSKTPGYFFAAAMIEKKWGKHIAMVLNTENLFDYRQSRHEALFTGSISNPQFKPIWAPIDGRIVNFSIRYKL